MPTSDKGLIVLSGGGSGGDMLKSVYDPATKEIDAFSMNSMDETATSKVLTNLERAKLSGIADGATVGAVYQDSMSLISTLATQEPSALDTFLPINFNPIDVTSPNGSMSYNATTNKLTLNSGLYFTRLEISYGRSGGAGESNLFFASRFGPLGFEVESTFSLFAKLDNARIGIPANVGSIINITTDGTEVDYGVWRDSSGNNSGGLFQTIPLRAGAATSPSASAFITKIG